MRAPTILLFDIDGTLITTGGAARRALEGGFERRHGRGDCLGFSLGGMTDRAIMREGLRRLDAALDGEALEAEVEATLRSYLDVLGGVLTREHVRVHAGVTEALDQAAARADVACGLGTGNVVEGARIKLEAADIYHRFAFGGFGSDHVDRARLLHIGAERGAAHLGRSLADCRVVVIGDTPRDIAAARAIGAECIAVATGDVPLEDLRAHAPTHAFANLADAGVGRALWG